jgi:hypothetical protein
VVVVALVLQTVPQLLGPAAVGVEVQRQSLLVPETRQQLHLHKDIQVVPDLKLAALMAAVAAVVLAQ